MKYKQSNVFVIIASILFYLVTGLTGLSGADAKADVKAKVKADSKTVIKTDSSKSIPLRAPLWKANTDIEFAGSPACWEDSVFVASRRGWLMRFSIEGKEMWRKEIKGGLLAPPSVDEKGLVYIASPTEKELYCYDGDGNKKWTLPVKAAVRSSLLIAKNHIYTADDAGNVYALKKDTKNAAPKVEWETSIKLPVFSSPALNKNETKLFIPTKDYYLFCLDASSGKILWKFKTFGVIFTSPAVTPKDEVYITTMDHHLYKISAKGELIWKYKTNYWNMSSPVLDADGNIYFGSHDNSFYCISPDGKLKWKHKSTRPFLASPVIDSAGTIYMGDATGALYAFSPSGKILWTYKHKVFIRSFLTIFSKHNLLLIGTGDAGLLAFKIKTTLSKSALWPKVLGDEQNSGRCR